MAIVRLFTGADDRSHMEELDLDSNPDLASMHGARAHDTVIRERLPRLELAAISRISSALDCGSLSIRLPSFRRTPIVGKYRRRQPMGRGAQDSASSRGLHCRRRHDLSKQAFSRFRLALGCRTLRTPRAHGSQFHVRHRFRAPRRRKRLCELPRQVRLVGQFQPTRGNGDICGLRAQ